MTRKEAREYIIKHCNPHRDTSTQWDDAMECAIKALEKPERKVGKWKKLSNDTFHCRECGKTFIVIQGQDHMNFCPNCEADMRGGDEG